MPGSRKPSALDVGCWMLDVGCSMFLCRHCAAIPPQQKSVPVSSPFPARHRMEHHRRCGVCRLSNHANCECADRPFHFPALASSCSRSAARGRFLETKSGCRFSREENVQRPMLNVQRSMFNESIRWIEQSLVDAKIGGKAALFFNITPESIRSRSAHQTRWAGPATAIPRSRGWRAGRGAQPSWQEARELREWSGRCGR